MKTKPKASDAPERIPCFECEDGTLQPVSQDYTSRHPRLGEVIIPAVPMLRCDKCGDTVLGDEGNQRIDAWFDKALNAISPEEVQQFLAKYGLTQKEAAQITGYGEKNISRWASGRARPSESVSNILRLLLSDEGAFERLRRKDFLSEAKVS